MVEVERGEGNAGKIRVMDTCCVCGKLEVITTNRLFQDQVCYRCDRIIYRLRAGADIRMEDTARAEKAAEYLERKAAQKLAHAGRSE